MRRSKVSEAHAMQPEEMLEEILSHIAPIPTSPVTVRILSVETGATDRTVTFKVVNWPELGPWTVTFPKTFNLSQAKGAVEARVRELAETVHDWYGFEWSMGIT